jgi:hypothetical protein
MVAVGASGVLVASTTLEVGGGLAIGLAVAAGVLVVAAAGALAAALRAMRAVRSTLEDLRREADPALAGLREAVSKANAELARVDGLLGTAESVAGTLDAGSRLAYLAFSNPVVKLLAFGTGVGRGLRRLRRGRR